MRINKLIELLESARAVHGNVEVHGVCPMNSGFLRIEELLHRSRYRDDSAFSGNVVEKGNFIAIEFDEGYK